MWVFLNNAFLSIVKDKDDAELLMVRARMRGDIERVFRGAKVRETPPPADYRFRARIDRHEVADALRYEALQIDYTNFKKSVPDKSRHDAYLRVWSVMAREQEAQLDWEEFPGRYFGGQQRCLTTVKTEKMTPGTKLPRTTARPIGYGILVDEDGSTILRGGVQIARHENRAGHEIVSIKVSGKAPKKPVIRRKKK